MSIKMRKLSLIKPITQEGLVEFNEKIGAIQQQLSGGTNIGIIRRQAIPKELYEAADVDGASPFQKFFKITLPQITAVISILFMIRFIWNFNKFEDVFLLTGGASGTRTLPINVYQQGFAISDIGTGSAVSIVIVILLLLFMFFYFKLLGKRVDEN